MILKSTLQPTLTSKNTRNHMTSKLARIMNYMVFLQIVHIHFVKTYPSVVIFIFWTQTAEYLS